MQRLLYRRQLLGPARYSVWDWETPVPRKHRARRSIPQRWQIESLRALCGASRSDRIAHSSRRFLGRAPSTFVSLRNVDPPLLPDRDEGHRRGRLPPVFHGGERVPGHYGRPEEYRRAPFRLRLPGAEVAKDDSSGPKCSVKVTPEKDGQYKFVIKNAGGTNTVTFNVKVAK